jgi:ABC-type multidrug transport system permease subunit
MYRDHTLLLIGLYKNIFFGLFLGFVCFQLGFTQSTIQDRRGLLFFFLIDSSYNQMSLVQCTFALEKEIVSRERQAHMYQISAYYVAKMISEIPIKLSIPLLNVALIYWIAGLKKQFIAFVIFVVVECSILHCACALGLMVSAIVPAPEISALISDTVMILFLLFAGFNINLNNIPLPLRWIQWLSFLHYGYEALCINEFTGQQFSYNNTSTTYISTGDEALQNMSLSTGYGNLWKDVGIVIVMTFLFHCLAYLGLRKRCSLKRLKLTVVDTALPVVSNSRTTQHVMEMIHFSTPDLNIHSC